MLRRISLLLIIYIATVAHATAKEVDAFSEDSVADLAYCADSVIVERPGFFKRFTRTIGRIFAPEPDTLFIEPQKYNWTLMAQVTQSYDHFRLESGDSDEGNKYTLSLAPEHTTRFGPFFGWRWLFLGYTFNVNVLQMSRNKIDINSSFYTPSLGIDITYRDLGAGYQVKDMGLDDEDLSAGIKGMDVDGLKIKVRGLNVYYIVNNRRYSHQAVFNQTNRQVHSAGSWMFGAGIYKNSIAMDWDSFKRSIAQHTDNDPRYLMNDSTLLFQKIGYTSIALSAGYGYNWVFARNWAAAIQLTGAMTYIHSYENADISNKSILRNLFRDFSFSNFGIDGTARAGVVWNNSRWFAGANAIYHMYNYHQKHFKAYNIFGTVNVYVGFNFSRRKK